MFEFHTEYRNGKCGNKELSIRIVCEYDWETDLPDVEVEDLKRFETGELSNLWIKVTAISLILHDMAHDNLGGIHVLASDTENQLMEAVKEHQMIDNVVEKLVSNLENKYRVLKGYFE
jgi:hypothetical protein